MKPLIFLTLCTTLSLPMLANGDDLLSLYEQAVLSSPELLGSEYAVELARAQEDRSFGELLPQISLVGNYSLNHLDNIKIGKIPSSSSDYPGTRATLSMQQPLFDLQSYLLMRSQQARTSQSEESLLNAHQKLISQLIERYVDALESADKNEIIAAELESTDKQLVRVKAMQAREMAMITDLYELEARTQTLRTELIDSENNARVALNQLRELTGSAVEKLQPIRLQAHLPEPDETIDNWVTQAGQINPELLSLRRALDAARQSITAYRAGYLPRIDLQVNGTYSDTTIYNRQSQPFDIGTAAVQATVPIYAGGTTSAKIREAEARARLAEAQLEQKLRELEKMTRAAFLDMKTSPTRSKATDQQLAASEKSRDAMKKGYELGVVTIVDLLNAEKRLSDARLEQRRARYRYFKARSSLYYQAGRLIAPELMVFNDALIKDAQLSTKPETTHVK